MNTIAKILILLEKWRIKYKNKQVERSKRSCRRKEVRRARKLIIKACASDVDFLGTLVISAQSFKEAAASLGMQADIVYDYRGEEKGVRIKPVSGPTRNP